MSNTLKSIRLSNFKSIRQQTIELESLNVLIGANGAGKSNLLSFFKLLNELIAERLQAHVEQSGGANSLLHYGSKKSPFLEADLTFETNTGESKYFFRLAFAAVDRLFFSEERIQHVREGQPAPFVVIPKEGGYRESELKTSAKGLTDSDTMATAHVVIDFLERCPVYQFHETSSSSRIRSQTYVDDNRALRSDGSNLAAFLFRLHRDDPACYSRIRATIQGIAPFFEDFVLDPVAVGGNNVRLNWRERGSDHLFGPHQLSDGTLRAMCLIALLLQPFDELPGLIVIDEPELGLHPAAIQTIAALMMQASLHCQVVIGTQSTALLDEFEPSQVIVVERDDATKETRFERLDPEKYHEWLGKYALHELWERNVIGGGPF